MATMKVSEVIKRLEDEGWKCTRQKGSHRQFKKDGVQWTLTVAGKPSLDLAVGTLQDIKRKAGWL